MLALAFSPGALFGKPLLLRAMCVHGGGKEYALWQFASWHRRQGGTILHQPASRALVEETIADKLVGIMLRVLDYMLV